MGAATRALLVATTVSLIGVIAATLATGNHWWLWTAWAVLAAGTVVIVAADRRRHG
ncbi:hypothetical protein ACQ86F_31525 [Streptomyces venezuelae ATCC 10712]